MRGKERKINMTQINWIAALQQAASLEEMKNSGMTTIRIGVEGCSVRIARCFSPAEAEALVRDCFQPPVDGRRTGGNGNEIEADPSLAAGGNCLYGSGGFHECGAVGIERPTDLRAGYADDQFPGYSGNAKAGRRPRRPGCGDHAGRNSLDRPQDRRRPAGTADSWAAGDGLFAP